MSYYLQKCFAVLFGTLHNIWCTFSIIINKKNMWCYLRHIYSEQHQQQSIIKKHQNKCPISTFLLHKRCRFIAHFSWGIPWNVFGSVHSYSHKIEISFEVLSYFIKSFDPNHVQIKVTLSGFKWPLQPFRSMPLQI